MASRGRYGSRSVERSLHYPQGFHDPFKSLSPIALRLNSESKRNPSYPATATVTPTDILLVQNQRITTQSIIDFGYQTIALLEKLEVDYPHLDAIESAAFPALTLLLNKFKEFKNGDGMTTEEMEGLEETAAVFLRTLGWTAAVNLDAHDRAGLLVIRKNIREAIGLLKRQKERGEVANKERARAKPIKSDAEEHAITPLPGDTPQLRRERMGSRMIIRNDLDAFSPGVIEIAGKMDPQGSGYHKIQL